MHTIESEPPGRVAVETAERESQAGQAIRRFCERWPHLTDAELPDARRRLRSAVAAAPRDGAGWWSLGMLEGSHGDPSRALDALNRAASLLPEEPRVVLHMYHLLQSEGETASARRCLAHAVGDLPGVPSCVTAELERLSVDSAEDGAELSLALAAWLESRGWSGPEPNASQFDAVGFPLDASDYLIRAMLQSDDARTRLALGRAYARAGMWSQAYDILGLALELAPADPELAFELGHASLEVFRRTEGVDLLIRALRERPELHAHLPRIRLSEAELDRILAAAPSEALASE